MPSLAPYIPSTDAGFDSWVVNFDTLILASPPTYGLTALDAASIDTAVTAWSSAFALVNSPTTKTAATVAAKNTAKTNTLNTVRPYAQQVGLNPGVSTDNKIALGLNPRTSTPTPITPPNSFPALTLISLNPGVINMSFRDSQSSPSVKAKPYGVKSMQFYGKQSETPITNVLDLVQLETVTKSPFQFSLPGGYVPGKTWYFAAVWQTQKGDQGPFSGIMSLVVV